MTDVEGVRNLIGTGLVQLVGGSITGCRFFDITVKNYVGRMTVFTLIPSHPLRLLL